ncbi:Epoxyqueuosine reductase [Pseudobythopirellula maris]|uniref:Epoxyqueuosine reductase n=1 Tax=Pseudobythopirellula maris TaxID=2527991 RepID=A0A5C5ZR53_9BACT|nr:tRNA epoxyqueuosine(34) reductase QueG [Pseudobythopirellula maris]TWT89706.1 Epoxyqueuosine reductase [Pseudobythopirellula maris]
MSPLQLAERLKKAALELGFSLAGVTPAATPSGVEQLQAWLDAGFAGEMTYLADRRPAYDHPEGVLPGAKSLLVLATPYRTLEPQSPEPGQGRVSRYAWGPTDYHDYVRPRLHQLADTLRALAPGSESRCVIDTAPLLEREFARLAGLGWQGKNTMLIHPRQGSWFFLSAVLTNAELAPDEPFKTDHCGTCTACLDACPTQAFPEPGVLDARRCISYLTIEQRGLPSPDLRDAMGEWVFGCDVCQDVCPWNRKAPATEEPTFSPLAASDPLDLAELFELDDAAFRQRFRKTALWRPKRRGLLRNAAIALGNAPAPTAEPGLVRGLSDAEPLVRAACAWALGRYGTESAAKALERQSCIEEDPIVLEELANARST